MGWTNAMHYHIFSSHSYSEVIVIKLKTRQPKFNKNMPSLGLRMIFKTLSISNEEKHAHFDLPSF